jgi:hypothetical protein
MAASAILVTATPAFAAPVEPGSTSTLTQKINDLTVAPHSHASTYDRDAFDEYDRAQVLATNFQAYPKCDGYYSQYDEKCYTIATYGSRASADDQVDIDEAVSRAEAWRSGAWQWSKAKRDEFITQNTTNLEVMTDSLNEGAKSDNPITAWQPQHHVLAYVTRVVYVKSASGLSVTKAEKHKLLALVKEYGGAGGATSTSPRTTQPAQGSSGGGSSASTTGAGGSSHGSTTGTTGHAGSGGNGQVTTVPHGSVDTGGGATAGVEQPWLLGLGGAAIAAGAGAAAAAGTRLRKQ